MAMPHMMNCPHSSEGWCLTCVQQLQARIDEQDRRCGELEAENAAMLDALRPFAELWYLGGTQDLWGACFRAAKLVPMAKMSEADQAELQALYEDSRRREREGEQWEEYTGNGR